MNQIISEGLSFALPLFVMAIGGIYSEKSGITNLALEGLQGFGAFTGAFVAVLIAGFFRGSSQVPFLLAFSLLHALLCIRLKANQVISGVVINILAISMTTYLTKQLNTSIFGETSDKFVLQVSTKLSIPGLETVPILGGLFTNLYSFEIIILVIAAGAWFVLYHQTP